VDYEQYEVPATEVENDSTRLPDEESRGEGIMDSCEPPNVEDVSDESTSEVRTPTPAAVEHRRSRRQVSKPAWMRSGEFDMGEE
jgi:hypothetical protein